MAYRGPAWPVTRTLNGTKGKTPGIAGLEGDDILLGLKHVHDQTRALRDEFDQRAEAIRRDGDLTDSGRMKALGKLR